MAVGLPFTRPVRVTPVLIGQDESERDGFFFLAAAVLCSGSVNHAPLE